MKKLFGKIFWVAVVGVLLTGCGKDARYDAYSEEELLDYLEEELHSELEVAITSEEKDEVVYEVYIEGTQLSFSVTDQKLGVLKGWELESQDEIVESYFEALSNHRSVLFRAYESFSGEASLDAGYWAGTEYTVYYDGHIQVTSEYAMPCDSIEEQERAYYTEEWEMEEEDFETIKEFLLDDFEDYDELTDGYDGVRWSLSSYSPSGKELHNLSSGYLHGLKPLEEVGQILSSYEVTISEENRE